MLIGQRERQVYRNYSINISILNFCSLIQGGMLQRSNGTDISIDMSRRNQGLGFARIAKLVTSKNVNILKKEESQSNGGGIPPASESKQE